LKALRITAISLLALLGGLLLLAAWLLNTEPGSRALFAAVRGWLPAGITVTQVGGAISGTLRITQFHYRDEVLGLDLVVDQAELEFSPMTLLARRLSVQRAQLQGVHLEFFTGSQARDPAGRPARDPWVAPIDMSLDDIRLQDADLTMPGSAPLLIRGARLSGSWIGARIEARELSVDTEQGSLQLDARIVEQVPRLEHLRGKFDWNDGQHRWQGRLDARGSRHDLRLETSLEAPVALQLRAHLETKLQDDRLSAWRAKIAVPRFDPRPLTDALQNVALDLEARGDRERLELAGVVALDDERLLIENLAATRSASRIELSALRLRLNSQPGVLTGQASLKLDAPRSASARIEWDETRLPEAWAGAGFQFSGQAALTAVPGKFAANGSARLSRAARASALTFRVDGDGESLRIEEFELTQATGGLSIDGHVDLGDSPKWKLSARGQSFDPSLFFAEWPGSLHFDLTTDGEWSESAHQARVRLPGLRGKLRGRAVAGNADLTMGKDLRPRGRAHVESGSAVLDVIATPGPGPRVEAKLDVNAIEEWRSDWRGALQMQLTSTGRWPDVTLTAQATATDLHRGADSVESAVLKVDGAHGRTTRGSASLITRGLQLAGLRFDEATARLEGEEAAHQLQLEARGDRLELSGRVRGSLARQAWNGQLEQLKVDLADVPPLALARPVRLGLSRQSIALDSTCLTGGEIEVCAGLRSDGHAFAANYSVRALPLELLTTLAAPQSTLEVEGLLEGRGEISRAANGSFSGRATLVSGGGALVQSLEKHPRSQALRVDYRDFRLDADLTPGAGHVRVHSVLVDQGELDGSLAIGVGAADPPLDGKASIALRDLAPLGWWLPQLAKVEGSAQMEAAIGGTVQAPRVALTLRGTGLDAEVPLLGLHLREGNVTARAQADGGFEADGSLASGDGSLRLSGERDARAGVTLKIGGTRFLAANVPGARVAIAPDLALSGKPGNLLLAGSVTIEEAEVNLEKLSINKSYRASPDVVVVDREQQKVERALGLTTDVRILFGDRVRLAGFGLESTVSGELRVTERDNEPSRAVGEVRVAGTYEAFGRKLNIERGRLQYAGTALDDPQLDILAVRKIDDITAKLRVTGTAQQPKLDVFTDPAMSQTDAMSYLLTGQSASDLHGQDGAAVSSAAQSVGSVLGNRLAKRLGGKVGFVDEIGVEQNTDLGGSAFTVGKYLSPKLFVSYGVGLFEPGSAVTVRYEFTKHWSLEANDTPEDQHAGIRYRIER
jgi:translocation and assembly module TamB